MYELIFTNNFFINFFNSFLFIIFNIFFSYLIHLNLRERNYILFKNYQPLIIFFLFFSIIALIFNLLILFNNYQYFNTTLILVFALQFLFIIKYFSLLKKIKIKLIEINRVDKFIILLLVSLYLISILPISDADSISLHQNLSNEIYLRGLKNLDLEKNLGFAIYSNTQNLLIISPILNSDNFGAQLNIIILIFFFIHKFRENKNFILIILSCPLIIYFISAQKLQLFFGILYLLIFIIVNEKLIKNKFGLFITIFLLIFYSSGNLSYILFTIPLYIYIFLNYKKEWIKIIYYSAISFLFTILPVFLIKHIYFSNFLAPFFDQHFGNNNFYYHALSYSLRATEGWLENASNFQIYYRPFISFNLSELSSSLGVIFLFMLININLQKKTKFFSLIIIVIVISTGQILPRYYLEAFLILSYYFNLNKFYLKALTISQNLIILAVSLIFINIVYFNMNVVSNKEEYMNKFSFSYFNSIQQKELNIEDNILDLTSARPSLFYNDNILSARTLILLKNYPEFDKYFKKLIDEKSIKYIILDNKKNIPACLKLSKIQDINQVKAIRNFLIKPLRSTSSIFKIQSNNCKF